MGVCEERMTAGSRKGSDLRGLQKLHYAFTLAGHVQYFMECERYGLWKFSRGLFALPRHAFAPLFVFSIGR